MQLRQHEAQRPDDVRRHAEQPLALDQRLAHQAEFAIFQIAQPAVDQLGARGRGMAGQVFLLHQQHGEATSGRVAGDSGAIDAAAHHEKVISAGCLRGRHASFLPQLLLPAKKDDMKAKANAYTR
jgi:hypothetical protein